MIINQIKFDGQHRFSRDIQPIDKIVIEYMNKAEYLYSNNRLKKKYVLKIIRTRFPDIEQNVISEFIDIMVSFSKVKDDIKFNKRKKERTCCIIC